MLLRADLAHSTKLDEATYSDANQSLGLVEFSTRSAWFVSCPTRYKVSTIESISALLFFFHTSEEFCLCARWYNRS